MSFYLGSFTSGLFGGMNAIAGYQSQMLKNKQQDLQNQITQYDVNQAAAYPGPNAATPPATTTTMPTTQAPASPVQPGTQMDPAAVANLPRITAPVDRHDAAAAAGSYPQSPLATQGAPPERPTIPAAPVDPIATDPYLGGDPSLQPNLSLPSSLTQPDPKYRANLPAYNQPPTPPAPEYPQSPIPTEGAPGVGTGGPPIVATPTPSGGIQVGPQQVAKPPRVSDAGTGAPYASNGFSGVQDGLSYLRTKGINPAMARGPVDLRSRLAMAPRGGPAPSPIASAQPYAQTQMAMMNPAGMNMGNYG